MENTHLKHKAAERMCLSDINVPPHRNVEIWTYA